MNGGLLLVLGLLIACVGLFIVDKPRMDVVALLVIIILPLTFRDAFREIEAIRELGIDKETDFHCRLFP
jgi:Zn-dependent membrane protease YugP